MNVGQIIMTEDCVKNADGVSTHPAIVTKVWSLTEVNCMIIIDGPVAAPMMAIKLQRDSVAPTGRRFRLPT